MLVQEPDIDIKRSGPCADCGIRVKRRIECVDGLTHSTVELCQACWIACQQRQAFAGGCCG
jgi:hypothetical protein